MNRKLPFLIFALLAPVAFAAPSSSIKNSAKNAVCADCIQAQSNPLKNSATPILAVTAKLLECPPPGKLELAEAKRAHARLFPPSLPTTEKEVHGVRLFGTDEELKIAEELLKGRLPSPWPTKAIDQCGGVAEDPMAAAMDVRCALSAIFGSEESALRALSIAKKSGYLVSLSQQENPDGVEQLWRPEEVRAIDYGLRDLPTKFHRMKTFRGFFRVHDSYQYCKKIQGGPCQPRNYAAMAHSPYGFKDHFEPGRIVMYKGSFDTGFGYAMKTVAHEMTHEFDFSGAYIGDGILRKTSGFQAMSWDRDPFNEDKGIRKPDGCFPSDYGSTEPAEDFAESVANYSYESGAFRKKCGKKYDFIEKYVFDGKEPPRGWPALNAKLATSEAKANALLRITSCLKEISRSTHSSEILIWERTTETSSVGNHRSSFADLSKCPAAAVNEIIAALPPEEQEHACLLGPEGVKKAFADQLGSEMDAFMEVAFEIEKTNPKIDCAIPGKMVTKDCFWSGYARALMESDPNLSQLPPEKRRELSNEIHRLVYP